MMLMLPLLALLEWAAEAEQAADAVLVSSMSLEHVMLHLMSRWRARMMLKDTSSMEVSAKKLADVISIATR